MTNYEFLVAAIESPGVDCVNWTGGTDRNGYGKVWDGRKHRLAHVVALELTTPRPDGKVCSIKKNWVPGHKLDAAHGPCHNTGCFNPAHLSWRTSAENIADKKRDGNVLFGERNSACTIPKWKVDAIRAEYKGRQPTKGPKTGPTQKELADKYGLSRAQVGNIWNGKQRSVA